MSQNHNPQRHKIAVPDLGKLSKQHEGHTVWLKQAITLPNGVVIHHAAFAGHTAFQININGIPISIPVGLIMLSVTMDDGDKLVEIPQDMVSHITPNKDFPPFQAP